MQHKYITRAFAGNTTGYRQCPGEFREAEYSPQTGSVQSNAQCQDLPPKVPDANTHQPLLLTCRNSCHTSCPGPERTTSIHFPSAQLKGRESTPLQNTRTGNRLACQMWQWEKSAEINASSVASSLMRQQFPTPTAGFLLKTQATVLFPSVVGFVPTPGSLPRACQSLPCLAGNFSVRGLGLIYIQNNAGESGSLRLELLVCGSKQSLLRTHCN